MKQQADTGPKKGFTLVELLVVIAVIGVLASLLLPALARAKDQALLTTCRSNLRQWAYAVELYALDHGDSLPREKAAGLPGGWKAAEANTWTVVSQPVNQDVWFNTLARVAGVSPVSDYALDKETRARFFQKNLFMCPAARPDRSVDRPLFPVAINSKMVINGIVPKKGAALNPINTVLFAEAGVPGETKFVQAQDDFDGRPHIYANRFSHRHHGRGNLLFFDGHYESVKASEVVRADGKAHVPQERIIWTLDPGADPNQK